MYALYSNTPFHFMKQKTFFSQRRYFYLQNTFFDFLRERSSKKNRQVSCSQDSFVNQYTSQITPGEFLLPQNIKTAAQISEKDLANGNEISCFQKNSFFPKPKRKSFLFFIGLAVFVGLGRPKAVYAMNTGHIPSIVNMQNKTAFQERSVQEKRDELEKRFQKTQKFFQDTERHLETFKKNYEPLRQSYYNFTVPVTKKTFYYIFRKGSALIHPGDEFKEPRIGDYRDMHRKLRSLENPNEIRESYCFNFFDQFYFLDYLSIDMLYFANRNLKILDFFFFFEKTKQKFETLHDRFQKTNGRYFTSSDGETFASEIQDLEEQLRGSKEMKQLWNFFHRPEARMLGGLGTSQRYTARPLLMLAYNLNGVVDPSRICKNMFFFPTNSRNPVTFYDTSERGNTTEATMRAESYWYEDELVGPPCVAEDPFPQDMATLFYQDGLTWPDYLKQINGRKNDFDPFWISTWLEFCQSLKTDRSNVARKKEEILESFIQYLQKKEDENYGSQNHPRALDCNLNLESLGFKELLSYLYDWCQENPLPLIEGQWPSFEPLEIEVNQGSQEPVFPMEQSVSSPSGSSNSGSSNSGSGHISVLGEGPSPLLPLEDPLEECLNKFLKIDKTGMNALNLVSFEMKLQRAVFENLKNLVETNPKKLYAEFGNGYYKSYISYSKDFKKALTASDLENLPFLGELTGRESEDQVIQKALPNLLLPKRAKPLKEKFVGDKNAANFRKLALSYRDNPIESRIECPEKDGNEIFSMFSESPRSGVLKSQSGEKNDPSMAEVFERFIQIIRGFEKQTTQAPIQALDEKTKEVFQTSSEQMQQICSRANTPGTTVSSPGFEVGSSSGFAQGRPVSVPLRLSPVRLAQLQNFEAASLPLALPPLSHGGSPGSDPGFKNEGFSSLRRSYSLELPGARVQSPHYSPKRDEQGRLIFRKHQHP